MKRKQKTFKKCLGNEAPRLVLGVVHIPLAILCTSKKKEDTHILIFEVNSNFRNNGIGKKVLKLFQTKVLKNKPVTLICKKEVTGFFKKIGFEILENKGNSNLMKKNYN